MQTITNKRQFGLLALATILIVPLLGTSTVSAQAAGSTGTVSDDVANMVRSDGAGSYLDGVDCVSVAIFSGGGFWQLRTVANTGECKSAETNPTPRYLTLDFGGSTPPGDLDGDGTAEQMESAPARFIFDEAFKRKATTTPVHIYVLKVNPDGSTTQDTAWAIEYRNRATITINVDGSRTLSSGGAGTADVYSVILVRNKEQRQFVGTYDLPFSVIAN